MTRISLRLLACAALLAAPLAFTTPAFANDVDDEIQAAAPPHNAKNYGEFEQLASERTQLVAEHDRMIERARQHLCRKLLIGICRITRRHDHRQ